MISRSVIIATDSIQNVMQVEVVVGVHNKGDDRLNITAIMGSLNNAQAFNQYFQNFTYQVCSHLKKRLCCFYLALHALANVSRICSS